MFLVVKALGRDGKDVSDELSQPHRERRTGGEGVVASMDTSSFDPLVVNISCMVPAISIEP
jgi:hypothetical protein